jgi:hypothetical protein
MKKLVLALTALSSIAACAAAAAPSPQTAMASAALAQISAQSGPANPQSAPPPAVAQAASAARVQPVSAPSPLACDISATPTGHGLAISAVLNADRPVAGAYTLVITKIGAAGSSAVNQGGPFSVAAGARVSLGETELGLDPGDRIHAVLTLTEADGRVCRQELRS